MWENAYRKKDMTDIAEKLVKAKIDNRGRIYIPIYVRRKLSMKLGDRLLIRIEEDHLKIHPKTQRGQAAI